MQTVILVPRGGHLYLFCKQPGSPHWKFLPHRPVGTTAGRHFALSLLREGELKSDDAIIQRETETIHVSKCQVLLFSRPVERGLLVELLKGGVEHPGDIFADVRHFAFDACEVVPLLH